jgi:GIY-YIG catalytic domain
MKIKDKYLDTNLIVYVLLLEDNTYYIGLTSNLNRRLKKHLNNKGASFTRNKTFKIIETIKIPVTTLREGELYEDYHVMRYMFEHGTINVKGGTFLGSKRKRDSKFNFYKQAFLEASTVEKFICHLKSIRVCPVR